MKRKSHMGKHSAFIRAERMQIHFSLPVKPAKINKNVKT